MRPLLTLTDVCYSQSNTQLLDSITLSVSKNHVLGLLGVNGAGKSTTLKIAAGLLRPDSGYVKHADNVTLGYVPEKPPLISQWTVQQCLYHVCQLHMIPKNHRKSATDRIVQLCQLEAIINKPTSTLSKGNQQRVAIAQALIHTPDIVILDEPTSGLDPQQIMQFRELVATLRSDTAIIFSSHIMHEVSALCDSAVVIHQGKMRGAIDLATSQQSMFIEFTHPVSDDTLSPLSQWKSRRGSYHRFAVESDSHRQEVLQFCLNNRLSIAHISGADAFIESEFISLITQDT